jgi:hypothetical protein
VASHSIPYLHAGSEDLPKHTLNHLKFKLEPIDILQSSLRIDSICKKDHTFFPKCLYYVMVTEKIRVPVSLHPYQHFIMSFFLFVYPSRK